METEDYARSILQPGSSQDTAMPRTLVLLNNIMVPHPIPEQERKDVMYKLFQTLKTKVQQIRSTYIQIYSF